MGFIKAFTGALSQTFADQWKDYYVPQSNMSSTVGLVRAVPKGTNNGVGENTKGADNIISNGSKIIVPEGMGLITMQDGAITGFVAEAGGFIWQSDDVNSNSFFSGNGFFASTLKTTWERFKFGGQPGSQQLAFYVNLKEITGIHFGTSAVIQWNDSFFETKVGAMARGDYSLRITDPLLFVKQFLPAKYLVAGADAFDFNDVDEEVTGQLLNEFTNSLSAGITRLSVEAKQQGIDTYDYISANRDRFGQTMAEEVENSRRWKTERGLEIVNVTITIEYDEATKELLKEFQIDDKEIRKAKRMGEAYSNNMAGMMASASGQAMQNAASNDNGAMMGFMGMGMAQAQGANMLNTVSNMNTSTPQAQPQASVSPETSDPYQKLTEMKKLLDAGVISQEDFDKVKAQVLGI